MFEKGIAIMKQYIGERVLAVGNYILESEDTVRGAADKFGVSKSTVHKDIAERLLEINLQIARQVCKVLEKNLSERHIRGGMATKQKYKTDK